MRQALKLVAVLGLLAGTCAGAVPHQTGAGWCVEPPGPLSSDWAPLAGARVVVVRESARAAALQRLSGRSVIPLARQEVVRLAPTGSGFSTRRVYLVRGGLLLSPAHGDRDLRAWEESPMTEVYWSRRHRAVAVLTMLSTPEKVIPHDLPMLLETPFRPSRAYVRCLSAD